MVLFHHLTLQTPETLTANMPPRGKKNKSKRRRKSLTSLIKVGSSIIVANATTKAFFGVNAWNFVTDSWFGRPKSAATDSSWEISLYEIATTLTGMDTSEHGFGSSGTGLNLSQAVQRNMRVHGPAAIGAAIFVPIGAKMISRLARGPIRDANKLLKVTGISSATGVKI